MDFKPYPSIERLQSQITITEKVHGSNAQILIILDEHCNECLGSGIACKLYPGGHTEVRCECGAPEYFIKAGSRNRWLTLEDDNFGFARWVEDHKDLLIDYLGEGRHFGEWYGQGINSGYGLKEKRFALFNQKFAEKAAIVGVDVVPVLYKGMYTPTIIEETLAKLKAEGSRIAPGFMKPEGIVVRFERNGAMFKQVFEAEETGWQGTRKDKSNKIKINVDREKINQTLQPVRLEKLLSRDERYLRDYPSTLAQIAKDYVADMEKEDQYNGLDEVHLKEAKRAVFPWIKEHIEIGKAYP